MLTPILDYQAALPLYEQLYLFVRTEVEAGRLHAHERLPSKRVWAEHLKISQMTVETAYSQLVAEGYLYSRPKSGYFVQPMELPVAEAPKQTMAFIPQERPAVKPYHILYDFSTDCTDTGGFPFSVWARLMRETLNENSQTLLQAADSRGDLDLRKVIAGYLREYRGIDCRSEQIIVGAGTEYLFGLVIQLLGYDAVYAAEDPGYPKIHQILGGHNVASRAIPMDQQGIELNALLQSGAQVVHVTPSHQFPLGIIMPVARRRQLLAWAAEEPRRYILEDDYDSEFRFSGRPIPALKTLDTRNRVIYFNTFAKSLAPSLRFGYMVLPDELLTSFHERLGFYSSTVSSFEQRTLYRFLNGGYFERHLNRMRKNYRTKRDILLKALSLVDMRNTIKVYGQNSGLHLLLKVDNGMQELELCSTALQKGVKVYGLSHYTRIAEHNEWSNCIVLGYAGIPAEKLEDAMVRLAQVWL